MPFSALQRPSVPGEIDLNPEVGILTLTFNVDIEVTWVALSATLFFFTWAACCCWCLLQIEYEYAIWLGMEGWRNSKVTGHRASCWFLMFFFVQSAVHVMPMASSTPICHRSRWLSIAGHQFANAWMYSNYMLSSNWRTWIEHAGFGKPIIDLSGFVDHYCVSINADHMSMFRRYTTIFTSYCRC